MLGFWAQAGPDRWFTTSAQFDAEVRARLGALHERAASGELADWEETPEGSLALLILLDQAPRNIFRGTARAFASDAAALRIARRAVERGFDVRVSSDLRAFFYLPFMHSEDIGDQERCIALAAAAGDEDTLEHARIPAEVIRRFGRFPHRNPALGRQTTPAERDFLEQGGFSR